MKTLINSIVQYRKFLLIGFIAALLCSCGKSIEAQAIESINTELSKKGPYKIECTKLVLGEKKETENFTKWKDCKFELSNGESGTCRVKLDKEGNVEAYSFRKNEGSL